jgi:hypothetical protein
MAEETQGALVRVFDAEQESEVMVVQGLLESAGIESVLTSLDAPQDSHARGRCRNSGHRR